jgi:hypothetical protein
MINYDCDSYWRFPPFELGLEREGVRAQEGAVEVRDLMRATLEWVRSETDEALVRPKCQGMVPYGQGFQANKTVKLERDQLFDSG